MGKNLGDLWQLVHEDVGDCHLVHPLWCAHHDAACMLWLALCVSLQDCFHRVKAAFYLVSSVMI